MIPYSECTIYGPYKRAIDNREHVIAIYPDGKRVTVSYPKYLMEIKLERYLSDDFQVHHIDGNVENNSVENLSVVARIVHSTIHTSAGEMWTCAYCGKQFEVNSLTVSRRKSNIKRGKCLTGPFCSRSCSGKVNH